MCRHIKAELFRSSRSGMYFPFFIIINIFITVFPFILEPENIKKDLSTNITTLSELSSLCIFIFGGCFVSLMLGNLYLNRTYYYEIMNGTSTHTIIFSKLITYVLMSVAFIIIPNLVIYSAIGINNGTGEMSNIWLPMLLYSIIVIHVITSAILISMIIRHIVGGSIIIYVETMAVNLVNQLTIDDRSKHTDTFLTLFPPVQFTKLTQTEYSADFIIIVILSFIIESVILYFLAYKSYRRKNFK